MREAVELVGIASAFAIGGVTIIATASRPWTYAGVFLLGVGLLLFLLLLMRIEIVRREQRRDEEDRRRAFSFTSGDGTIPRRITFSGFKTLPSRERRELLQDPEVERWYMAEMDRSARTVLDFYLSFRGRLMLALRRLFR